MNILYKKKEIIYESLMKFNDSFDDSITELINESLGAFKEQYKIAKLIASYAYSLLMNNSNSGIIEIDSETIKKVSVGLDLKTIWGCSASLKSIKNGSLTIDINIPYNYKMLDKEKFINALSDPISHELMHYNVIVKRYENGAVLDERPSYYESVVNIIRGEKYVDTLVYEFAYALYSTYYQEVCAMVSQASIQFKNFLINKEKNNVNANSALKQCNSFIVYNNIVKHLIPTISLMSDADLENEIVTPLKENGIDCDAKWARKQAKKMYKVAKYAIHNIIRNISSEFYN